MIISYLELQAIQVVVKLDSCLSTSELRLISDHCLRLATYVHFQERHLQHGYTKNSILPISKRKAKSVSTEERDSYMHLLFVYAHGSHAIKLYLKQTNLDLMVCPSK